MEIPKIHPEDHAKSSAKPKTTSQKLSATGFPGLYRHDEGHYYGKKKIRGVLKVAALRSATGVPITERKMAERALMAWADSLENQTAAGGKRITFGGLLDAYNALQQGKKEKTKEGYEWAAKCARSAAPQLLETPVAKITPLNVSEMLAAHFGKFKPRTFNGYSEYLNRLFQFAVSNGYVAISPFKNAENKRKKNSRQKPNAPTTEQFAAIISHVRNQPFADGREDTADLMEFLGLAALGEAEASGLQWRDVDFENETLQIQRQKTGVHFQVPFYPWLKTFLLDLFKRQKNPAGATKMFKIRGCKQALKNACSRLKYPHFSPRNLRQFGIIRQIRAGLNVKLIAKFQGHSDGGKLILDTYSEVLSADDAAYQKAAVAGLKE